MNNLTVVESKGLIKVYETDVGEKVVDARELHKGLANKTKFNDWVSRRLSECEAMENEDYIVLLKNEKNLKGGRPSKEYILKLDIAKEMAMLERNDEGKKYRRYFIELEKKYKAKSALPTNKHMEAKAKLMNAKTRQANLCLKIADKVDISEYKQIMYSKAAELISDKLLLPLPVSERKTYSATEIGERIGLSKNMVGRLAKAHNLKTEEYGKWYYDKSPYSNKEVNSFRYYDNVIPKLREVM